MKDSGHYFNSVFPLKKSDESQILKNTRIIPFKIISLKLMVIYRIKDIDFKK